MNVVHFLASGVNGAAGGTATFTLRGTASTALAVMFDDFEGQVPSASNVVTLDAYGAAEVYVNAYVDVEVKDIGGTTLRTVTVGNSATSCEVVSTSFNGQNYAGGGTAPSLPVNLKTVLDLWVASAGAEDFQVAVNGSDVNITTALASFAGMFFNVKDPTYGATGDGVTDDAASINAAIAAANSAGGGIVFVPGGTYICSASIDLLDTNVHFMGSGAKASMLEATGTGATFRMRGTAEKEQKVSGIGFTSSIGVFPASQVQIEGTVKATVSNCEFTPRDTTATESILTLFSGTGLRADVTGCRFNLTQNQLACVKTVDSAPTGEKSLNISNCVFVATALFTGDVILGGNINTMGCEFDMTLVTSGVYRAINNDVGSGVFVGSVTGCSFRDGGSNGAVFQLDGAAGGTRWSESGNSFEGYNKPIITNDSGQIYNTVLPGSGLMDVEATLGSRIGRSLTITAPETSTNTLACGFGYDTVFFQFTTDAAFFCSIPAGIFLPGMKFTVSVENNSANPNNITVGLGTESAVPVGSRATFYSVLVVDDAGVMKLSTLSSSQDA